MRGLDTNVVIRFVVQDHAEQFRRANAVISAAAAAGEKLYVGAIVLCEVVWVLRSAYGEPRARIAAVIAALLETPEIVVEDADLARRALFEYKRGAGDFADHFIASRNRRSGCETTLTFDKSLRRSSGFKLL